MIKELYEASLNYLAETKISKHFKQIFEKRPILGWTLFFSSVPFALKGLSVWAFIFLSNILYPDGSLSASMPFSQEGQTIFSPEDTIVPAVGGPQYVTFTGLWKPNKPAAYLQNGSEIFLKDGERSVRFDQGLPVPFGQMFRYVFSLGGKTGGNLQIGRFGSYEITIGDGDFKTIVVRDGGSNLALESAGLGKVKLGKEILRDISSELIVIEEILSEREFKLTLNLNQEQTFSYIIPLPSKWKEQDDIYFALLDLSEGDNKTSVYWSEPEIGKFINN